MPGAATERAIQFNRAEHLLFAKLITHPGMLRSREQLLDAVAEGREGMLQDYLRAAGTEGIR